MFLDALARTGTVVEACHAAGIGRSTAYDWRAADDVFAEAWREIDEAWIDRAERELYRRAVEGVEETVYAQGVKVGTIRRYSDGLLALYLKSKRRTVYADRVEAPQVGDGVTPELLDAAAEELERRIAAARADAIDVEVVADDDA